jgi:hypothetical protein
MEKDKLEAPKADEKPVVLLGRPDYSSEENLRKWSRKAAQKLREEGARQKDKPAS